MRLANETLFYQLQPSHLLISDVATGMDETRCNGITNLDDIINVRPSAPGEYVIAEFKRSQERACYVILHDNYDTDTRLLSVCPACKECFKTFRSLQTHFEGAAAAARSKKHKKQVIKYEK